MAHPFENRKKEHFHLALSEDSESQKSSGLHRVQLIHEALPDLNFEEVSLSQISLGKPFKTPFYISSMTGGWKNSEIINLRLAKVAESRSWSMGIGSQRAQLTEIFKDQECRNIRKACPNLFLFGNIGLSQAITASVDELKRLVDTLEAQAMTLHLNPLQEAVQKEGTPYFKRGLKTIKSLIKELSVPLIVKETGCGFSSDTLDRLTDLGLAAVDISGMGGTHWGKIEGQRLSKKETFYGIGETFSSWGVSTLDSLLFARKRKRDYEMWASGGLKTGLDAAKALSLGAIKAGFGRHLLKEALKGEDALDKAMARIEQELKISLFCTGSSTINELQKENKWTLNH